MPSLSDLRLGGGMMPVMGRPKSLDKKIAISFRLPTSIHVIISNEAEQYGLSPGQYLASKLIAEYAQHPARQMHPLTSELPLDESVESGDTALATVTNIFSKMRHG